MSSIILNGKEYNDGISDIVEITQSAYNALPDSKLTDGILYCISDSADGADGFPPLIYSTYEREVGVWTDGKPLYQKTVHISALPSSAGVLQYPHNISNIDKVCHYESISRSSMGSAVILNRAGLNGTNFNGAISYDVFVNTTIINITVGQDRSNIEADVTIWYTKTTDTAGSGTWNGQGGLAHHYSTSETVIGTWIDGKPIYEKTVVLNNLSVTNNQWAKTNESATDIEAIIGGFLIDNQSPSQTFQCDIGVDGGKIAVLTWFVGNSTRTMSYLIFRYTKTT